MTALRQATALAAGVVLFCGGGWRAAAQTLPAKDAGQIRAVLQEMTDAWNAHDMKAFVGPMTDDVEWVNVVGMWWRGKAQVYRAHAVLHQTMFKDRQVKAPESVTLRALTPDVALVTEIVPADGYTTPDGVKVPPNRNVLTLVFVHRAGRWLVAEGHNTIEDERAAAHDPGKP